MLMLITNVLLVNEDKKLFVVSPILCVFFLFFFKTKSNLEIISIMMLLVDLKKEAGSDDDKNAK